MRHCARKHFLPSSFFFFLLHLVLSVSVIWQFFFSFLLQIFLNLFTIISNFSTTLIPNRVTLSWFVCYWMNAIRSRWFMRMAEDLGKSNLESSAAAAVSASTTTSRRFWPSVLRWIPTSTDHIINSEKRLLSLVKYVFHQT